MSQHHTSKWIRADKRLAIYLRDNWTCCYCGTRLADARPEEIHLDHLKCKSKGGSNDASNLVVACRSCNCSRQNKPWTSFASEWAVRVIRRNRRRNLAPYRAEAKRLIGLRPAKRAA